MPTALASVSSDALNAELRRRAARVSGLVRKRNRAARQVARLAAEIALLGGKAPGGGAAINQAGGVRRRAKNATSLSDALAALLKGKSMQVTEAAAAVQEAGYRTHSRHFRTMVNIALLNKARFKRTGRGRYTAR